MNLYALQDTVLWLCWLVIAKAFVDASEHGQKGVLFLICPIIDLDLVFSVISSFIGVDVFYCSKITI